MTNARSKSEVLGDTAKSYVRDYWIERLYDRRKEFNSRFTDKGIEMESQSLSLLWLKTGLELKINTSKFEDADIVGTPDILINSEVWDIKNAYSCFSMPHGLPLKPDYEWQMHGYMAITGATKAKVIYTLMNGTEEMIKREAYSIAKTSEGLTWEDCIEHARQKLTYANLPDHLQIIEYEVKRDEAKIAAIRQRVAECREYYQTLQNQLPCNP